MLALAAKGLLIGILVSAPMGPVGMLCIQRTLSKGRWHGFVTGLGAMVSDIIYAMLTSLGMGVVVNFVEANQAPLQLAGSLVLSVLDITYIKVIRSRTCVNKKSGNCRLLKTSLRRFF